MKKQHSRFYLIITYSADIYTKGRQKELALASYEKALELYPCFSTVNRWMKNSINQGLRLDALANTRPQYLRKTALRAQAWLVG